MRFEFPEAMSFRENQSLASRILSENLCAYWVCSSVVRQYLTAARAECTEVTTEGGYLTGI